MKNIHDTIASLELAQIGWVVPDIHAAVKFMSTALGIHNFPEPEFGRAQDIGVNYYGKIEPAEWLVSQTYNGGAFIELIQPLGGKSIFQDYLDKYPMGGVQHMAFRLPVEGFEKVVHDFQEQGYEMIGGVDHPIARMVFFDTYKTLGVATEIMGITPEGWAAIKQMEGK